MKLLLLNTVHGLMPMYDDSYEEKKKLKLGEAYTAEIRKVVNPQFFKKYHALINAAWNLLLESQQQGFRTTENFRKYVQVAAGHCDIFYSPRYKEWVEIPKSIAWDKIDETEFEDLYTRVRTVIDTILAPVISTEEFERVLLHF